MLKRDLILDLSLLVQLLSEEKAQHAGMSYDYDLCPFILSLRGLGSVDIFGYNRS